MRDHKENKKISQNQDNGGSVIKTQSLNSRLAGRPVSPVPEIGKIKDSVGPQAGGNKVMKKEAQIKASVVPQAAENKDTKEDTQIKASVGPQAAENKVVKKEAQIKASVGPQAAESKDTKEEAQSKATAGPHAVENKVVKGYAGPQGQVEASVDIILKKDKGYCYRRIMPVKAGSPGNTYIKNRVKNELAKMNTQKLDSSDNDEPLLLLRKSQKQQQKEADAFHIHMERQNASK
eukprot:12987513-Ditylum_brightwellii.AAC.1